MPPDAMSANVVKLEELGHGATGSVYKAVHATTLQILAVKEVKAVDEQVFAPWGIMMGRGDLQDCFAKFVFCRCAYTIASRTSSPDSYGLSRFSVGEKAYIWRSND